MRHLRRGLVLFLSVVFALGLVACPPPSRSLPPSPIAASYTPTPLGYGFPLVQNGNYQLNASGGTATGQIPVWDGGADGGVGWELQATSKTLIDCDLTLEPSQSLTTDGAYTICTTSAQFPAGIQVFKQNSANDASPLVITHGTGMVITPVANTNISAATLSAPLVRFPVITVCPTCTLNSPLRFWFYWSSNNAAHNFDAAIAGYMIWNASYPNQLTYQAYQGFQSGLGWGSEITVIQSNVTTTGTILPFFSSNVGAMSMPSGLFAGNSNITLASGLVSGQWPNFQTGMSFAMSPEIPAANSVAQSSAGSGLNTFSAVNFYFAANRVNSTTTGYAPVLARFRVDSVGTSN